MRIDIRYPTSAALHSALTVIHAAWPTHPSWRGPRITRSIDWLRDRVQFVLTYSGNKTISTNGER